MASASSSLRQFIIVAELLLLPLIAVLHAQPNGEVGSEACRPCHAAIFAAYSKTGMANSSGRLSPAAPVEQFQANAVQISAAQCRVSAGDSGIRFDFRRDALEFSRTANWFVGSGHVGRNYLYARDGFLFQAPVSYYTSATRFDASPGYARKSNIELTRPVTAACLQCHSSRLQPVAGTENRFATQPFLEGGISCERCHGPGDQHVARSGKAAIVNPAKLTGERRDSICAQCHLTGAARVARSQNRYQPGGRLSDTIAVYVWNRGADTSATNHFEQLASSACQRKAGAKLWCRTCHPVHGNAVQVNAVCRNCHAAPTHQPANDGNCTGCHMPRTVTAMGDHVAYTDHSIARRPGRAEASPGSELIPFAGAIYDARDLALAYAAVNALPRAIPLLEKAAAQNPRDVAVLAQLAQAYDRTGLEDKALPLYQRVLQLDPAQTTAAINLGGYLMKRGRPREAMALWESALRRNPGLVEARINLGVARFQTGDRDAAIRELKTALDWEPDHPQAAKLLAEAEYNR